MEAFGVVGVAWVSSPLGAWSSLPQGCRGDPGAGRSLYREGKEIPLRPVNKFQGILVLRVLRANTWQT